MSVFLAEVPGEEQHRKCFFNVSIYYDVCDHHLVSTFCTFKASKEMCPPVPWDRKKRQRHHGHYRVDWGSTVRDSPPGLARQQAMVLTRLQVWLLPSGQGQTKRQSRHTRKMVHLLPLYWPWYLETTPSETILGENSLVRSLEFHAG